MIKEKEQENQAKKDSHDSRISEIGGIYEAREFLHFFEGPLLTIRRSRRLNKTAS